MQPAQPSAGRESYRRERQRALGRNSTLYEEITARIALVERIHIVTRALVARWPKYVGGDRCETG
jgi:hypothetical protein